jgi:hypothetical protein
LDLCWWDFPIDKIKSIASKLSSAPDVDMLQRLLDQKADCL